MNFSSTWAFLSGRLSAIIGPISIGIVVLLEMITEDSISIILWIPYHILDNLLFDGHGLFQHLYFDFFLPLPL